jgi:hypothetical protein
MATVHAIPSNAMLDPATIDHGGLLGLADDDHAGYLWLAGRAGGQVAIGGTGASDELELQGSTDAAKGIVRVNSPVKYATNFWGVGGQPTSEAAFNFSPNAFATGAFSGVGFRFDPSFNISHATFFWAIFDTAGVYQQLTAPGFAAHLFANVRPRLTTALIGISPLSSAGIIYTPEYEATGTASVITSAYSYGLWYAPLLMGSQLNDTMKVTDLSAVKVALKHLAVTGAGAYYGTVSGVSFSEFTAMPGHLGSSTLDNLYGIHFPALTFSTIDTFVGIAAVVFSQMTSASNRYFLYNIGGAQSLHYGRFYQRTTKAFYFGSANNATISYNGTDFVFDPDLSGSGRVLIGATGDDDMLLNDIEIDGDLNHDGALVGFYGTAPAVQSDPYSPTNVIADRAYDANATTIDELADVLGTLIADLQATGLIA